MIHFIVAVGDPRAVRALAPQLAKARDATRFVEGIAVEHVAPDATWAMAAIDAPDPLVGVRIAVDDGLVVLNGPALSRTGPQARVAQTVRAAHRRGGVDAVVEGLGGSYNLVAVDPARGTDALCDGAGTYPLYWGEAPGVTVVSNRSTTVARALGNDGWDLEPLAWIIGHANLFGPKLPAAGVQAVTPGSVLRAGPGGGRAHLERGPTWAWPAPEEGTGRDNLSDAEWEEVAASLIGNLQALRQVDRPLRLGLTGGKDSRLNLALAKAAGFADELDIVTTGPADSPEVEVAAVVARVAGVSHRRIGPPAEATAERERAASGSSPPPFDAAPIWRNLRRAAYRYESIVCGWSALQNPTAPPTLGIKGFGGELYRRGNAKQFRDVGAMSEDELAERFVNYHQKLDPLGILVPGVAEHQRQWLRGWVHRMAREVRLDLLPEKFYVDHRLGHWSGPFVQFAPLRVMANPLLSPLAMAKNLELSPEARCAERFHFEVMRRTAPELLDIPFLNDTWAPAVRASSPVPLPDTSFRVTARPARMRSWGNPGWQMLDHEAGSIEALFHQALGRTAMPEICDMRRLKRLARRPDRLTDKGAKVKELFSAISVAIALLDEDEQVVDQPRGPVVGSSSAVDLRGGETPAEETIDLREDRTQRIGATRAR